jgi:hypothetical protein
MSIRRISLGFDLRVNPETQKANPAQMNQSLMSAPSSPISADQNIWSEPEQVESLMDGVLPDFANPLHLAKSIDLLLDACRQCGIPTADLCRVCLTTDEANIVALIDRFGPGYFENQPKEEDLISQGWQLRGFDVVDPDGLISGLKGVRYNEPTRSQLRNYFGSTLNEVGLFNNAPVACQFAGVRGLQVKAHAPFVVIGVLTQDQT